MKFLLGILLVALAASTLHFILPWWGVAIFAAIIAALLGLNAWLSWFYGFLGTFLVWGGMSFFMDNANEGILSHKMADLFQIDGGILLIVITACMGGVLGGFGAMTGSLFRKLFKKDGTSKRKRKRRR